MHAIPFEHLLASHMRGAYRLAVGLLGNEQEGHEIAQDSLAKAWGARESYDRSRPFAPWLYRIVRNSCWDALGRRGRRPEVYMDPDRALSSAPSAIDQMSQAETEDQLREAMDLLTPEHREVIALRHFQELSYAEIAEALEINKSTVMSRLYRARRTLTRLMEDSR
jgi:RNA polymerase sigma-70 factor (ECF subfamily)